MILKKFTEHFIFDMNEEELYNFSLIIENNDLDILDWITKKQIPPKELHSNILTKLLNFRISNLE